MVKSKNMKWIIGGVVAVIVLFMLFSVIGSYNSLVALDEGVNAAWGNVQSAYQRRADLIPNLVDTVKGYRDYEADVLAEITEMRSQAGQTKINVDSATTPEQLQSAMGAMNSVLSRLLLTVERYPDLKASESFLSLQDELAGTENRIKVERDKFNEAVKKYNTRVRKFPTVMIAGMFGFERKEGFSADEGADQAVDVDFS